MHRSANTRKHGASGAPSLNSPLPQQGFTLGSPPSCVLAPFITAGPGDTGWVAAGNLATDGWMQSGGGSGHLERGACRPALGLGEPAGLGCGSFLLESVFSALVALGGRR